VRAAVPDRQGVPGRHVERDGPGERGEGDQRAVRLRHPAHPAGHPVARCDPVPLAAEPDLGDGQLTVVATRTAAPEAAVRPRSRKRKRYPREGLTGWLFAMPAMVMLLLFMLVPILMALWVSLTKWTGQGSPFVAGIPFAGVGNYVDLLVKPGLERDDFMTS